MNKKYEFTGETISFDGHTLHRIRAVKDSGLFIKAGQLGGWIEKEFNLSHEGNCWISCEAKVYENGRVYGNAQVSGHVHIFGNARVYDQAFVYDYAMIRGNAQVYDNVEISGTTVVTDNAQVRGSVELSGHTRVYGLTILEI